jgi:hypothetical protein
MHPEAPIANMVLRRPLFDADFALQQECSP